MASEAHTKSRLRSMAPETGKVQWEELMKRYSEANQEQCKAVRVDIPRVDRSNKKFPTGSQYEGTWDVLGMSGYGVYTFPHGVVYEGEIEDGMFHGEGELRYESGAIIRGKWKRGVAVERTLVFADGLEYSENDWKYCRMPDRRFTIEYEEGIQPGEQSYMTAEQPTREVPDGYYDTGDGFYEPNTKVVYKYDDITAIVRSPSLREQKWIVMNCRHSPDEPLGPCAHLYEKWLGPTLEQEVPPAPAAPSRTTADCCDYMDLDHDVAVSQQWSTPRFSVGSSHAPWKNRNVFKFQPSSMSLKTDNAVSTLNLRAASVTSSSNVRSSLSMKPNAYNMK